jgi:hypothetical protein
MFSKFDQFSRFHVPRTEEKDPIGELFYKVKNICINGCVFMYACMCVCVCVCVYVCEIALGSLVVACLPFGLKIRGFKPRRKQ